MFNLIKAEIYQLKTRRTPKIMLLISIISGFLIATFPQIINFLAGNPIENGNLSITAENPGNVLAIYTIESHIMIASEIIFTTSLLILFILTFLAFNKDLSNRTIMNPVAVGYPRWKIFFSKYVATFLYSLTFYIFLFTSFILFNLLINGGNLKLYFDILFIDQLLPALPYWAMWQAVHMNLLFISDTGNIFIIYYIIEMIVRTGFRFIGDQISCVERLQPYLFFNFLNAEPLEVNGVNIKVLLAILYLGGFILLGVFIFNRKEIK